MIRYSLRAMRLTPLCAALAAAFVLSACSTPQIQEKALILEKAIGEKSIQQTARLTERSVAEVPLHQRVPGLWVSDRVIPKSASQNLPSVFDRPMVYRSTESVSLAALASDVQRSTGIPVRLVGEAVSRAVLIDYVGSARQAMDTILPRYGVTWEYTDGGINITQSITRMFTIERSGVDVGGTAGNRRDPWAEMEANLKNLAPNARMSVSRTNNTITVVGAPLAMPDIEKYVNLDARQASRRIVLRWQLVNYQTRTSGEAGLALNYLLNRSGGTASLVAGAASATAGAGILAIARDRIGASTDGSSYALSLLNQSGNTTVVREGFSPLKHNDTQEFGNTRTIGYAAKSSLVSVPQASGGVGTTGSTNTTAVVTEQANISFGLDGKFGISVFDSEKAELSYDFKVTVLDALRKQQTAVQYQEYPETSERKARGRLQVEHGQTYIINTETADSAQFDRRGVLPGAAAVLGGSESGSQQNDQWMLLVTPIITNSAF